MDQVIYNISVRFQLYIEVQYFRIDNAFVDNISFINYSPSVSIRYINECVQYPSHIWYTWDFVNR